jgi:hypothetical protein
MDKFVQSVLSAITLLNSLLIQPDFETNQTDQLLYNLVFIILFKSQPVFQALKIPALIAQTVAGQIIFIFLSLFRAIISLVSLSGIHSAIIIIFLKLI